MAGLVIENATLDGARAWVDSESLHDWELRGWTVVGPCADRSRNPLRSDDEQAAADQAEAARVAALLTPTPEPTAGKGRKTTQPASPAAENQES